jgi:Zn-dependent metalloprotease
VPALVCCLAVAIGVGGATAAPAQGAPMALERSAARAAAVTSLRTLAGGTAHVVTRGGAVTFVGAPGRALTGPSDDDLAAVADRFLQRAAPAFGVSSTADLELDRVSAGIGTDSVRYQQTLDGVPVLGGEIAVQIDDTGAVRSASGEATLTSTVDTTPTISPARAGSVARAATARADAVDESLLVESTPALMVYDPALLGASEGIGTRLVWHVEVRTELGDVDRVVLVDAADATIALHWSERADARNRQVCDDNGGSSTTCTSPVRVEGGAAVASAEVNAAYDLSGVTYDFYLSVLGRDSVDGAGMTLKSTVNYSPDGSAYANAFWNGAQMIYGAGYASADDVVGHELTHGVTQYTSGLLYFSESGAINESISDVMGELIDLSSTVSGPDAPADRWLMGEQLPIGAIRDMQSPTVFGDPDRMTSPYFSGSLTDNRGVHTNSGVNNKAAYLMVDGTASEPGGSFNGQTITGLGITKTAKIYYEAETTLLGPGSDYLDLASALPQACANLVAAPGSGLVTADCTEVGKVVAATEMSTRPTTAGASLMAPVCGAGQVRTGTRFSDDMETTNGTWTSSTTGGGAPWSYVSGSSQSGARSMHVYDAPGPRGISTLTMSTASAFVVPSGTTTYLRFDHAFETDWFQSSLYDGGVVEYSTDNGGSWTDVGTLGWVDNGYVATLSAATSGGLANELAGRSAFGKISPSYQTSRADLSSLAGSSVRLRFRFATDNYPVDWFEGWFIDDVEVYTCGAASPSTTAPTTTAPATTAPATTAPTTTAPATTSTTTTTTTVPTVPLAPPSYAPVTPARLLDTRTDPGLTTADGRFLGTGPLAAGSTIELQVTGRAGVPADAGAVALNVTVTGSTRPGFLTVYPCGTPRPTASSVNFAAGQTIPNLVISGIGTGGTVCIFTLSPTHVIADLNGFQPAAAAYTAVMPARLLDTRSDPGLSTVDGRFLGGGATPGGAVLVLPVAGRAGVPADAVAAVLNVTVTGSTADGYVTVFPCGTNRPNASNVNHVAGETIANLVVSGLGVDGAVCLFTSAATHVVVDLTGFHRAASVYTPVRPARLLDTRTAPGLSTVDGLFLAGRLRPAGSTLELQVAGRAGVPDDATTAVLNITVTDPTRPGFLTVYPCGSARPTASNVNYEAGQTIPNLVISGIGVGGRVCIFTLSPAHVIADLSGYQPG